jgi:hypothetical protein
MSSLNEHKNQLDMQNSKEYIWNEYIFPLFFELTISTLQPKLFNTASYTL